MHSWELGALPGRSGEDPEGAGGLLGLGRQPQQDGLDVLPQTVDVCLQPLDRTLDAGQPPFNPT